MSRLRDRYPGLALITGASSGIGEEFARQLAEQGFNLLLVARREDRLRKLATELHESHGIAAEIWAADLGHSGNVDAICNRILEGGVGLVICNAGFGLKGLHAELDSARLREMVRVNCEAPTQILRATAERFGNDSQGGIIIVSSTAAFQGVPFSSAYAASKAFSLVLGEGLMHEVSRRGVDVLTLCPGPTRTEGPLKTGVHPDRVRGMMSSQKVVQAALRGLGRTHLSIPGATNQLGAWLVRWFPRSWSAGLSGRIMKRVITQGRQGSD